MVKAFFLSWCKNKCCLQVLKRMCLRVFYTIFFKDKGGDLIAWKVKKRFKRKGNKNVRNH